MKNAQKLYAGLFVLISQVILAHDDAPVQINNTQCAGVTYQAGIWNESSRIGQNVSSRSNQTLATCNDVISGDNCGQFDMAFNFSENFCAIHTDNRRQAIFNAVSQTYYYGPENFVNENNRVNYTLPEGVDFSCNICALNESIRFESSDGELQNYFLTGQLIYMNWLRHFPHPVGSPYNGYKIESQKRPLNSNDEFQYVAQTNIHLGAFARVDLTEQLLFTACHEYKITLSVQDLGGLWADSSHIIQVFDNMLCPPVADSAPVDRTFGNTEQPVN
jgi:hypothetical protein